MKPLRVILLSTSDLHGGAAVVTYRLMLALREIGLDARMLVAKKSSDSLYVEQVDKNAYKFAFMAERGKIFVENGFNRNTLFKIDTASDGVDLAVHPWVADADVIVAAWVNQGFLSLIGLRQLAALKKPIVWVMHDMWNMTGICHHAGYCEEFELPGGTCHKCPLLKGALYKGLAQHVWRKKERAYDIANVTFVAVSNWLAGRAKKSHLLADRRVEMIHNPFPLRADAPVSKSTFSETRRLKIVFGAARLDDPIKGHRTLVEATRILAEKYPDIADSVELLTFGDQKDPDAFANLGVRLLRYGRVTPVQAQKIFEKADVVVSTSEWENLPGTLIEGQAWGCIPLALDHGGQSDIITHKATGYLVPFGDAASNAEGIAEAIVWAYTLSDEERDDMIARMRASVMAKFSATAVATRFNELFQSLIKKG